MTIAEIFGLIIPILVIILIFGIPIMAIYLDYKKKIAMIEKGLMPEDEKHKPQDDLILGTLILGIGLSLVIGKAFNLDIMIIAGFILASIGFSLLISYLSKIKSRAN